MNLTPVTRNSEHSPGSEGHATRSATAMVACLCALKLVVLLYAGRDYGYFRDELYYLACSRHLAWGYVDQPPLIAFIGWLVRSTLGDSMFAIRLLPALAGAALVALSAAIARELGGGRTAQFLAALATLVAPGLLATAAFFSMNAFEPLFWMGCAWVVIRIVNTGNQKLWIWFGVLAGLGLENKHSMLIFGVGIVAGLILTPQRKAFTSPWIWIGGAMALLIFLPNLLWNIHHHFPFVEEQANIRASGRDVALNPLKFFVEEFVDMHPLTLPIWLGGLWFFFSAQGKQFRALGWAWVVSALVIVTMSPRVYYLFPAFPLLFAAGGVLWERQAHWRRYVWPEAIAASAILLAPFAIPILSPETYIKYAKALHFNQQPIENFKLGPLPQVFADRFGWQEMTAVVAGVYNGLPAEVRPKTAIFARNYGEAAAIDMFGPKYGLPAAISGHQNYFLWGPRDYTGESVIVMQGNQKDLETRFATVRKVANVYHPYSMPYEHFEVFYCTGLKQPLAELWPQVKNWN